ncbi:thiol reductant ABC exporter subunit CydC [Thalassovita gelatinovora]|nr:thiol reductant ABC exporter subunit CydC [Thalassovita gelatinovora]
MNIALLMWRAERRSFLRGLFLSVLVLLMGAALLGLSGWFITAAAAAGLAGAGAVFDVFRPSAMVRLLALGRTVTRYGERLASHDATLRALSGLRIRLLQGTLQLPFRSIERLRANTFLNRVMADIDALDGLALRLVLPGLAGMSAILLAGLALWVLVSPGIAAVVVLGYVFGPLAVFFVGLRYADKPARLAEAAMQALRTRLIDLIAAREDLTVYGQLSKTRDHVGIAQDRHRTARNRLDRVERRAGFSLDLVGSAVTAATLGLGLTLAHGQAISPAQAAIGVFVALALAEAVAPVQRALTETGRMIQAARRVAPSIAEDSPLAANPMPMLGGSAELRFDRVQYRRGLGQQPVFTTLSFSVAPGETVALTGASGSGKSTILLMAAGCLSPSSGAVTLGGVSIDGQSDDTLQERVTLVPQRHALIAGTVAENLRLAAPLATDAMLWQALNAVSLDQVVQQKGGLEARLGFRGDGLSGGESRRLSLARAVLRKPSILLLDEPTEGLDTATAASVMAGLRKALPQTAFLLAAHRSVEIAAADRVVAVERLIE